MAQRQLRTINCIAYGMGDIYGGGSFFIISTFAMYYLVAVIGLSPILAGLIPGLGKVWDSISDPLMGYITDHTRSRHGRRRVFFLIAFLPVLISFILIWYPVNFSSDIALFIYYFVTYLFFYTTTTLVLIPYSALSAEMTHDFTERNKLTGFRMFFSMFATLLAGLLAQPLINMFGGGTRGHLYMAVCFGFLFAIPWVFVYLGTWELPYDRPSSEKSNPFRNFGSMFRNRSFRIHILMYICAYGAMDILMAWFKFYIADYLGRTGSVTIALGSLLITQIIMLPVYIRIANKRGHALAYRIGLSVWVLAMVGMYLQTPDTPMVLFIVNCIGVGAGLGAGTLIPYQILPFVADVDELMTGKKQAGIYAGAMTLVRKLIQGAIVLPLLGLLLTAISYAGPIPAALTREQLFDDIIPRIEVVQGDPSTLLNVYQDQHDGSFRAESIAPEDGRAVRKTLNSIGYKGFGATKSSIAVVQSDKTISSLQLLFVLSPTMFLVLGILCSLMFPINPASHAVLLKEIARLGSGGNASDVEEDDKRVLERMVGMDYERMPRFFTKGL